MIFDLLLAFQQQRPEFGLEQYYGVSKIAWAGNDLVFVTASGFADSGLMFLYRKVPLPADTLVSTDWQVTIPQGVRYALIIHQRGTPNTAIGGEADRLVGTGAPEHYIFNGRAPKPGTFKTIQGIGPGVNTKGTQGQAVECRIHRLYMGIGEEVSYPQGRVTIVQERPDQFRVALEDSSPQGLSTSRFPYTLDFQALRVENQSMDTGDRSGQMKEWPPQGQTGGRFALEGSVVQGDTDAFIATGLQNLTVRLRGLPRKEFSDAVSLDFIFVDLAGREWILAEDVTEYTFSTSESLRKYLPPFLPVPPVLPSLKLFPKTVRTILTQPFGRRR